MRSRSPGPNRRAQLVRGLARGLGRRRPPRRRLVLPAVAVSLLAVAVRLAYVADAAPTLYTWQQEGVRMAFHYTQAATGILEGDGLLYPRTWPDPSETRLVSRPPGYPVFVAAVHRTLGAGYADVLTAQALLAGLLPALMLVLVTRVAGSRAGILAGVLAAFSAPLAGYAAIVTPDAISALLSVVAVFLLWSARSARGRGAAACFVAAGATVGLATWLRPNFLLLAPVVALAAPLVAGRRPGVRAGAAGIVVAAIALVAPITIRNARIYGEFVPVSTNGGIVLWEGIADAGGRGFGARSRDLEVAAEEAVHFGDPRYARSWATPDGIRRDRARVRRSLEVIRAHPAWWATSVARRAGEVLASEREAPLVQPRPPELASDSPLARHPAVRFDAALGAARPVVRALQEVLAWPAAALALVGLAFLALAAPRRALLLALVPAYVVLVQSPMHFEARFALPKDAFAPALAAVGLFVLLGAARAAAKARPRLALLLVLLLAPTRLAAGEPGPVLVLGALEAEARPVVAALEGGEASDVLGLRCVAGRLAGRPAVVAATGVGKVNAAMTTALLLERFSPAAVIFTGVAGALDPGLQPGDVVVGERLVQHDLVRHTERGVVLREVRNPRDGVDNPIALESSPRLLELARRAASGSGLALSRVAGEPRPPRVAFGAIATGDSFVGSRAMKEELQRRTGAAAVEMEGAAVAQVCYQLGVPFLVVRGLSDRAAGDARAEARRNLDVAAGNAAAVAMAVVRGLGPEHHQ